MTVSDFVQSVVLILCLLATSIVLPIGLVVVNAPGANAAGPVGAGPVFVFDHQR